jgi:hypothetical protein
LQAKFIAINYAGERMEVALRHATVTLVCSGLREVTWKLHRTNALVKEENDVT